MSRHLQADLERLEKRLLYLAGHVEKSVRKAMEALFDRRIDLAEQVISADVEIDRREVELEEECLKVLALHQPVAQDLRFTAACLKVDNDLERIGDLACNIASRAISLASRRAVELPPQMHGMVEDVASMLRDSIDSFVKGDVELARSVMARDDEVDRANRRVIGVMLETMHDDPDVLEQALDLVTASKSLERIADHATNIAEDVIYLVEGSIVRHEATLRA